MQNAIQKATTAQKPTAASRDINMVLNGILDGQAMRKRFDDLLGEVDRNVGVVADLGNILFVGETPEEFVARFAGRICHVHAKDYLRKDSRWPDPGKGW